MLEFLSPQVPIERSFFRIPRISGVICGFWPQRQHSRASVLCFIVNAFAVAIGALGENLYGFKHMSDLVGALEAFCPGITKAISLLKIVWFFNYHKAMFNIVEQMRIMLMKDTTTEKRHIVEKLASMANRFCFVLLTTGMTTNAFFNLCPLVINLYRAWKQQEVVNVLPFSIVLPEVFVNYPLYPLTYCMLTLSGTMTVFAFSGVDGFFLCGCMYLCGLFRMLQHDIRRLFADLQTCEHSNLVQNLEIRKELAAIVVRHNLIIDLCTDFTTEFTVIILMHFLSAAFVLCSSILDLMLNSASIGILIYIPYSIAALTQLFLYCIGGSYVSESSFAVAETLYDTEWYKCDTKTRKMILMILRRSQKAKTIAVPFFTPSLSAFSAIISNTGSYIALLKTFL